MKFLIQRVSQAEVKIDNIIVGSINSGFLVLIGIGNEDTKETADKLIKKLMGLRIFEDENGKTNLSIMDEHVKGELLLVSQFTLCADCRHGNRPSFINAQAPDLAKDMYEYICQKISEQYTINVQKGVFGADMKVSLVNDGPFTIMLDSNEL